MRQANRSLLLLAAAWLAPSFLFADTIYQTNPQGKQVVIHRDTILVNEDSTSLIYKHFELKERRVVKVRLSKGSLPYSVKVSSGPERQRIVQTWKRFGHKASVTDLDGKTTQIFDAYLDFYPPGGRGSLHESVPPRTAIPTLIEGAGADEFEFSGIARVEFQGERVRVTLRGGRVVVGRFLMPTDKPAEARVLGITDQYDPASEDVFDFSLPLAHVKEIAFNR